MVEKLNYYVTIIKSLRIIFLSKLLKDLCFADVNKYTYKVLWHHINNKWGRFLKSVPVCVCVHVCVKEREVEDWAFGIHLYMG